MSQVGIDSLDGIGFFLVRAHFVGCAIVQTVIGWKGITVVLSGLRGMFQTGLQVSCASFADGILAEKAMSGSIYHCQDVDFVFFCFKKVYNSSNSATLGLCGIGAGGNLET